LIRLISSASKRKDNFVEIFHRDSGQRLAWCFIGDDESVEKIAEILSAKYLGTAAMELRAPRVLSLLSELRPGE
jgi:hypothetical protein